MKDLKTPLTASIAFLALALGACSSSDSTSSTTVSSIALSPDPCTVGKSDKRDLVANATFPDGTKREITKDPGAVWTSENTNTATVSAGTVVGVDEGVTRITVTYQGATGSENCTVGF